MVARIAPGEERHVRWACERDGHVRLRRPGSFARDPIDVWSADRRRAVDADAIGSERVDGDDEDVGRNARCRRRRFRARAEQRHCYSTERANSSGGGRHQTVLLPLLTRIRYRPPQKGGWHLSGKGASHLSPRKRGFLLIFIVLS